MTAATFTLTGTVEGDTSTSRSVYVVINTDVSNPTDDITYQKARRYTASNGVFSINDLPAWDPLNLPYDSDEAQFGFTVSSGGKKWTVPAQTTGSTHDVTEFEEPWAAPVPPDARDEALAAAAAAAASAAAAAAVGSTNDTLIAGRITTTGSATQVALGAAIGRRVGPTRVDLTGTATAMTAAAMQTVIDASPSGAEFYLSRQGGGDGSISLSTNPLTPSANGQKFVFERGLVMKQTTLYKPIIDVIDRDDITIHDLTALGPVTRTVGFGMGTFRGSSLYTYSAGIWSNGNRTRITGKTKVSGGFAIGINLSSWDTGTAAFKTLAHFDNVVEDLLSDAQNFSLLIHGQVGLRIGSVTGRNFVDDSAGANPLHAIYCSGSPTVRSANVQIGSVICESNPFGAAVAFKYLDGFTCGPVIASDCGRLASLIDLNGFDVGPFQLLSTRSDADANPILTGSSPFPQNGRIRSIYINDTADVLTTNSTNPINFVGTDVVFDGISIVTHRGSTTGFSDAIIAGTNVTVNGLKTNAKGLAGPALSIGKTAAAAINVTVRGQESVNASLVATVVSQSSPSDVQSTGVVIEHNPSTHRSGTFSGVGITTSGSGPAPSYTVKTIGGATPSPTSPFPLTTGERNMDPGVVSIGEMGAPASGQLCLRYFTAAKTESISQILMVTGTTAAAATPTMCKMGIYSVDPGTGNLTLVASTVNDTSLFAAANTPYTKALQSSFTKTAGQMYATASLVISGAAVPSFQGQTQGANSAVDTIMGKSGRVTARLDAQTDLPASITSGLGTTRKQAYCELIP